MILTIIIFVLTLLVLVVSHEFGHFIVAKKVGIKVLEFGFGLPPKIFGKKVGQTLVSLNLLPIGGFVRLLGEDETNKKVLSEKDSFAAQPVWQRIAVVVAGVIMNFLLAAIIFYIVLASQGFKEQVPLLTSYQFFGVNQVDQSYALVGKVAANSPAEQAGVKLGDRISKIDQTTIEDSGQLSSVTKEHAGQPVILTLISPEGVSRQVSVTPRANPPAGEGSMGVEIGTVRVANLNYQTWPQRLAAGFSHSYNLISYSAVVLGSYISQAFEVRSIAPVAETVSGPVGITNAADMILKTKSPILPYLSFVAFLSLNLAFINILPFPALDGGRLFFLLIEAVFKRKVKAEVERWVHTIGMAILIALIVLITFSDIKKFF